ncbi:MAG: hypothetical protein IRY97_05010 [Thermomicrobiaceae bacterium]|nr:hypothetical protein [Thermomicrobiaceae bacterium]
MDELFGTVARLKVEDGHEESLLAVLREWERERGPEVEGMVATYLFKLEGEPKTMILVAIAKDRDTWYRNANDPETDRWYRRLRENLEEDPIWQDGPVVLAHPKP